MPLDLQLWKTYVKLVGLSTIEEVRTDFVRKSIETYDSCNWRDQQLQYAGLWEDQNERHQAKVEIAAEVYIVSNMICKSCRVVKQDILQNGKHNERDTIHRQDGKH